MDQIREAVRTQFGCSKSKIKMHDYQLVELVGETGQKEVCVKCLQRRY